MIFSVRCYHWSPACQMWSARQRNSSSPNKFYAMSQNDTGEVKIDSIVFFFSFQKSVPKTMSSASIHT